MTNTSSWRIGADIPERTRAFLLRRFPPVFTNVHCRVLTFAYAVPDGYKFPEGTLKASIYGYHRGEGHEGLLLRVNGQVLRPDGNRFFVALSLRPGEEPVRAGDIDSDSIVYLDREIQLDSIRFRRFPLWYRNQETKKAA